MEPFGAIRRGVVVFLGGADDCADRVQLSSGTTASPAATSEGAVYEEGAMIPLPSWRSLTMADRKVLLAESCPEHYGYGISVISLPTELLDPFWPLRLAAAQYRTEEQLSPVIGNEDCSAGADAIIDYLRQRFQCSDFDEHGALHGRIYARSPSRQTISLDPDTRALVGLHVDSWYRHEFGIDRRMFAPNRVCINLGSDDRFFLFLNIPIGQMHEIVRDTNADSAHGYDPSSVGPSCVARAFMRLFPAYPVVRVRIRPGEAYVAPTENIAHDGSSVGTDATDVTLSVRGRFGLSPR